MTILYSRPAVESDNRFRPECPIRRRRQSNIGRRRLELGKNTRRPKQDSACRLAHVEFVRPAARVAGKAPLTDRQFHRPRRAQVARSRRGEGSFCLTPFAV